MIEELNRIQEARRVWAFENFGDVPIWQNALGVAEEAGELCHAVLKKTQRIRGDDEKHRLDAEDAVGDCVMYLMGVCDNLMVDFGTVVEDVSKRVLKRDWTKDPTTGGE